MLNVLLVDGAADGSKEADGSTAGAGRGGHESNGSLERAHTP